MACMIAMAGNGIKDISVCFDPLFLNGRQKSTSYQTHISSLYNMCWLNVFDNEYIRVHSGKTYHTKCMWCFFSHQLTGTCGYAHHYGIPCRCMWLCTSLWNTGTCGYAHHYGIQVHVAMHIIMEYLVGACGYAHHYGISYRCMWLCTSLWNTL